MQAILELSQGGLIARHSLRLQLELQFADSDAVFGGVLAEFFQLSLEAAVFLVGTRVINVVLPNPQPGKDDTQRRHDRGKPARRTTHGTGDKLPQQEKRYPEADPLPGHVDGRPPVATVPEHERRRQKMPGDDRPKRGIEGIQPHGPIFRAEPAPNPNGQCGKPKLHNPQRVSLRCRLGRNEPAHDHQGQNHRCADDFGNVRTISRRGTDLRPRDRSLAGRRLSHRLPSRSFPPGSTHAASPTGIFWRSMAPPSVAPISVFRPADRFQNRNDRQSARHQGDDQKCSRPIRNPIQQKSGQSRGQRRQMNGQDGVPRTQAQLHQPMRKMALIRMERAAP